MILVIDNFDSFTFNLVQYIGELNPDIQVIKNNEITLEEIAHLNPSHILISPGPGTPNRAGVSLDVIKRFSGSIPILGVCLGYQAIAMAYGFSLCLAPKLFHGKTSVIHHDAKDVFKEVKNPLTVMRYHSWVVDMKNSVPTDIEITAWTDDHIPMALKHRKHLTFGVQFHPESILTEDGKKMIKNFLDQRYESNTCH